MQVCNKDMEAYCKYIQLVILLLVAVVHREAMATKHVVGGSQGWDESTDFDSWASAQTFKVGDELEFKYSAMHSVAELPSESAFKGCNIGSALNSLNGGSNTVKLDKAGTRFFACGTSGHCEQGMKVKITTVASDGSPSSSSSPATNPSPTQAATSSGHQLHFFGFVTLIGSLMVSLVHFIVW